MPGGEQAQPKVVVLVRMDQGLVEAADRQVEFALYQARCDEEILALQTVRVKWIANRGVDVAKMAHARIDVGRRRIELRK